MSSRNLALCPSAVAASPLRPAGRVRPAPAEPQRAAGSQLAARDLVIATLAHDLRSPLGALRAVIDFVLEELLPDDDAHGLARQQLGVARRATDQMHRLVVDLLDGATIAAGRVAVQPASHRPAELAAAAI